MDATAAELAAAPLFASLDEAEMAEIAVWFDVRTVSEGVRLAGEGASGYFFFVLADGTASVTLDGEELATLGPGDFFGELSVLDGRPRPAQVVTEGPATCLALASWDFEAVLLAEPRVSLAVLRGLASRLRDITEGTRH